MARSKKNTAASAKIPQINPVIGKAVSLRRFGSWSATRHVYESESVWAINAALASGRPLLVRGEPGTGKSQLAQAAAEALGWPLLSRVINARFEPEDLLYRFDAVARLAMAQILPKDSLKELESKLNPRCFLLPEILWWAFNYDDALQQYKNAQNQCGETVSQYAKGIGIEKTPDKGVVVLIDEIDKADSEVPNSLLEALANRGFQVPYGVGTVTLGKGPAPLIILTTNEERELPPAFLRRCLVLQMDLPTERDDLAAALKKRARAHFSPKAISNEVLSRAIAQLIEDRERLQERDLPVPGQAELVDLLRALREMARTKKDQLEALEKIGRFALQKHRDEVK